jgi:predicted O-methyltransferase YrrM
MPRRPRPTVADFAARAAAVREAEGLGAVFRRATDRLLAPLSVRLAARRLRSRLRQAPTLSEQMEVVAAFSYRQFSLQPSQIDEELAGFLEFVQKSHPKTILEIGTGLGGTTVLLACAATDDALVVSVDLPNGAVRTPLLAAAVRASQHMECLRSDSHAAETQRVVATLLRGRPVDVLFIDGDHTSEGVRKDLEVFAPLVRAGGWIAFHDIVPGPYEFVGGVPELWVELRAQHETREFVANWAQGGLGIGAYQKS